ncbi:NAD(P)-binding protein [Xylariaceae sp. AK1471]|nr:NAD(P)-binding protein [Xylariaceae sp. AK1471]
MSSSKKLLVVFGATGNQGGSVINHVLSDSVLSSTYRIRAITRDAASPSAALLRSKGISDIVSADLTNPSSLPAALKDAHTVFLMSTPDTNLTGPAAKAHERDSAISAADACVEAGVSYLIFSTLPHVEGGSGGKYTRVSGFDAKAEAEAYMRTLPLQTAFFAPGSFMQNWHSNMRPTPSPSGDDDDDGSYVVARHVSPATKLPLIDTLGDAGKFVGAVLASPSQYAGKTFCAATRLYSLSEICEILSRHTGKKVEYVQVSEEQFKGFLGGHPYADVLVDMMLYQQDFGYYGPETEDLVRWAVQNARGKVTTFEEYLEKNPLVL